MGDPGGGQVWLAVGATFLLGLRHGVDHDHIAAIADITSVQTRPGQGMWLGMMYAAGHGFVVAALGVLVVFLGLRLPEGVDTLMERLVGLTLVLLGGYVFYTLIRRHGGAFRLRPRVAVLADAFLRVYDLCRGRLTGAQAPPRRESFGDGYGGRSSFVVGMIHGVGAETPTQLLLFLVATGLGGAGLGVVGVLSFVAGLLATNAAMCALAAGLFGSAVSRERTYRAVAVATGCYSLALGLAFTFGWTGLLPAF